MDTVTTDTPTLTSTPVDSPAGGADPAAVAASDDAALIQDELLVEEVSIDGMCGVY